MWHYELKGFQNLTFLPCLERRKEFTLARSASHPHPSNKDRRKRNPGQPYAAT